MWFRGDANKLQLTVHAIGNKILTGLGRLLWIAMTTGARRGELCSLRWRDVDLAAAVLTLERAIAFDPQQKVWFEKGTKTHQHRRVALGEVSVEILTEHRDRCRARVESLGEALSGDGFVFSLSPGASTWLVPSSVTQRYDRMATRLGIDTTLHKLRHYSTTELISSGVDVRTVAGRLGRGSSGMALREVVCLARHRPPLNSPRSAGDAGLA